MVTKSAKQPSAELAVLDKLQLLGQVENVHEFDVAWELRDYIAQTGGITDGKGRFFLYDREGAQLFLQRLIPVIESLPKGHVLLIRLDNVRATTEFVEEAVGNLVCRQDVRLIKERLVVLTNPHEGTLISIHRALEIEKDACMVLETGDGVWKLWYVGRLQPHLIAILDYVRSRSGTTSQDLCKEFNFKIADASRRLKELYEDGLIKRTPALNDEGKLTFVYTYFHPALACLSDPPSSLIAGVYEPPKPTPPGCGLITGMLFGNQVSITSEQET